MSEKNKALVRRAVDEVWNRGNFAIVEDIVSNDFVVHGTTSAGEIHGAEGISQFYGALRQAFPDLEFTIEDQIAEGEHVVTRWRATGTHQGPFAGLPPTGNQVTVTGIDIDRLVDGKVVECWPVMDELGLLQQLGAITSPNASAVS